MKERIDLVEVDFNPETGLSTATIETDLGRFTGTSLLREEDREIISSYAGCSYAEFKAIRNYLKARVRVKRNEAFALKGIITAFENSSQVENGSRACAIVYRAYYKVLNEIKELKKGIKSLGERISLSAAERDKILKRIKAARAEEDKE